MAENSDHGPKSTELDSNSKVISANRQYEIDNNPCYKEQAMSFDCLSRNNFDQKKCYIQFENYKTCKGFWNEVRIERMRNGVQPLIPNEEERRRILEERFKGKKTLG